MGFTWDEQEANESTRAGARARSADAVAPTPPLPLLPAAGNHAVARLVQQWRESGSLPGRYLQRKDVTIVGKPTKRFANLGKLKGTPTWKSLVQPLVEEYGVKTVEFHLNQMFSAGDDLKFESDDHFVESLTYDCENKTIEGEHNLQEQYMTLYGWKRRSARAAEKKKEEEAAKKAPAKRGGKGQGKWSGQQAKEYEEEDEEAPVLKVYRTMKLVNWERLEKGVNSALTGHMGDFKQAHNYLHRRSPEPKVLVEFTLKRGAERTLFSGSTMAFPNVEGPLKVPNIMQETLKAEGAGGSFAVASPNEGLAPGKVGIKAEGGEAGFSFGIGGAESAEVFMALVDTKKAILSNVVDPTAEKEVDGQDVLPSEGGEAAKGEEAEKEKEETPDAAQRNQRMQQFLQALLQVPTEVEPEDPRVEKADPSNQYVEADGGKSSASSAKPMRYEAARLRLRRNPGGGDCLFHAIAGRTLNENELLQLRQIVAGMRAGMPENQSLNAQHVAAALHQTQHPYSEHMTGRHNIPNSVYALLQAVPGMFAGEDELQQWCMRAQGRRVVVIDSGAPLANGALAVFTAQGRQVVPVTAIDLYATAQNNAGGQTIVLFKTPGHWERVEAIDPT